MRDVPALTLQRPWGWAILKAGKDVENRSWPTKHRGDLLIHQGKTMDPGHYVTGSPLAEALLRSEGREALVASVILGGVQVVGCHQAASRCCTSVWALPGQWHWEIDAPWLLREPVPARGRLGLWTPDADTLAAIESEMPEPCGHPQKVTGCGGCDPAAIEFVITDEGGRRAPRADDFASPVPLT